MARRLTAWGLTLPIAATGILVAHAIAYRVTGVAPGSLHGYLAHVPQVVALLVLLAVCALSIETRSTRVSRIPFALLGVVGFVAQEHLERLAHTGDLPFLLTNPAFLVGLALQVPVGLACLWLVRRVLLVLRGAAPRRRPPRPSTVLLALFAPSSDPSFVLVAFPGRGRAPPLGLR